MTEEELEKESKKHCNETLCSVCENPTCTEQLRCREWRDRRAGYYCGAEPREKQIQIDAEQIRALQKQNGELTDELTKKADTNHQLVEQLAKVSEENADLKCECRRCVYTDSPCVLSDYGKDKNGICDHFKDVFDENIELTDKVKELKILISSLVYEINQIWDINEMNDDLRRCAEKIDREVQLSKMAEDNRIVISALGFAIVPPKPKLDVKEI